MPADSMKVMGFLAQRRAQLTLIIGIVGYVEVATFPGPFEHIATGLDPSWEYALSRLPHEDLVFGRDVVFTFGPLGYLLFPRDIGSNLIQAAVLWVSGQLLIAVIVVYHYRRQQSLAAVVLFAIAFVLASAWNLPYEYQLLMIVALLLTVSPSDTNAWRLAAPAAAFLAGSFLFIKLTAGITAFAMVLVAAIAWLVGRRARARQVLLTVALPYGVAVLVLGLGSFDSPASFLRWLRFSGEVVAGYGSALSLPMQAGVLYPGLLAMGVFFVLLTLVVLKPERMLAALSLAPFALVGFRYSFVRHHGRFLFGILLAAIAVVLLATGSRRRLLLAGATLVVVLGSAAVASTTPECGCTMNGERITMARGWSGISALIQLPETRRRLAIQSERELREVRLPADWVAEIRGAEGGVDTVPSEISFLAANELPWNPNPVLQTYHAYTEALDRLTAQHFSERDAPEYVLLQFGAIDGRHPMWGAPAMWRSILAHYELAGTGGFHSDFGQVLLLRRRLEPTTIELLDAGRQEARIGDWIEVPPSEGLLFASLHFQVGLRGFLESLVWHVDAVRAEVQLESGQVLEYRLLPETSAAGLLLDLPFGPTGFSQLLGGDPPSRVERFRVSSGVGSFEPSFDITWRTATWSP